jgi:Fuc2NAc and GlcNAc transferase
MNWAVSLSAIGLAVALSWALTLAARWYSLHRQMLDTPNRRSSHTTPRPRGLGVGFVLPVLAWTLTSFWLFPSDSRLWVALSGGGLLVSAVGWLDDRNGLSSGLRLLFYGLASAWAVAWLGGLPELSLGFVSARLGGLGYALAWVGVFTFTNIYNFMDGIDGLAAAEAIFVTAAAGMLLFLSGAGGVALFCWVLGAALCGFIPWNWAPAKGFMGDVGSNFLGFTIAVLAISSEGQHSLPALIWVLLLGVFVVDGVSTFVRRLLRHKPPHEAHKTHAYQGAVQRGYSHSKVTLAVLSIDAVLAALAWAAWKHPLLLPPSIGAAFTLLLALHWYYSPLRRPENG